MRLPSPSETVGSSQRKPSGASSLHGWRDSRAGSGEAATANGTASQRPLSLRRGASTSRQQGNSSHLHGEDPHGWRLLYSIGDSSSGHERSPLEALSLHGWEIAGQEAKKRPQPTERPHSGLYPCGGEPQPTIEPRSETVHDFSVRKG